MVWQSEALNYSVSRIAGNLNISKSTVKRITNTFSATGFICKQPYPTENAFRIITKPVKLFIFHLALVYCSGEVSATLGVTVSESAICKVLEKGSFTHQKLAVYAIQQDEALRQQFVADVSMY